MKKYYLYGLLLFCGVVFSQEKEETNELEHIYNGNVELKESNFVNAEAEYRKAISENPKNATAKYNLGNAYYKNKKLKEAHSRYNQAQKVADHKLDKHKAFHNIGNTYMEEKKYDQAIEAYKNALRNNPKDDETRYNLALAKKKKEESDRQRDKNKDDNKDAKDKQQQKDKNQNQDQNKDQDKDKKEGDKDKEDNNKGDKDKEEDKKEKGDEPNDDNNKDKQDKKDPNQDPKEQPQPPQPKQGQLSPQQVQSILEAMNNQEKKLQEKLNAKRAKGVPVQHEKDW